MTLTMIVLEEMATAGQSCGRGAILGEGRAAASEAFPTTGRHWAALSLSASLRPPERLAEV